MASDEQYLLGLCDDLLGKKSMRQHRYDQNAPSSLVAAFYPDLSLAIDFHKAKAHVDDQLARTLANQVIKLVLFDKRVFALNDAGRLIRDPGEDREIVRGCLGKVLKPR